MKTLATLTLLLASSCAFNQTNVQKCLSAAAKDTEMQAYLAGIPVSYVAFVSCDGPTFGNDGRMHENMGCYDPNKNTIEVATVYTDGLGRVIFRYEDQIEDSLIHELIHAAQYKKTGHMWHPVERQ